MQHTIINVKLEILFFFFSFKLFSCAEMQIFCFHVVVVCVFVKFIHFLMQIKHKGLKQFARNLVPF